MPPPSPSTSVDIDRENAAMTSSNAMGLAVIDVLGGKSNLVSWWTRQNEASAFAVEIEGDCIICRLIGPLSTAVSNDVTQRGAAANRECR